MFRDLVDVAEFQLLVWSIRVVESQDAGRVEVHRTLVTKEFFGTDLAKNDPRQGWAMPSGIHTLALAARFLQATPSRVKVNGDKSVGRDIEWRPDSGGILWVERKDRAFRAALDDSPGNFMAKVEARTLAASKRMPQENGAGRMIVFGGFRPSTREAEAIRDSFRENAQEFDWSEVPEDLTPDVIAVEPWAIASTGLAFKPSVYLAVVETRRSLTRPEYQAVVPAMEAVFGNHGVEYFDGIDTTPHTPHRRTQPKVGRNDPCPCGSGKKFKKCCDC